jgi:UDP-2,3-diacylglucosamine pyrophosphatase LpxH
MKYRTIVMSDLHLGSKASRAKDIIKFLENNTCETLILNGDIIDGWALKRGSSWKDEHTKVLRKILKMSEKGTKVIWLRGNHDEFLEAYLNTILGNITIQEDMVYDGFDGKSYYIFHGDILDVFSSKFKLIAKIGSVGYDLALWLNRWYNKYREWRKLPYYSISNDIKREVKAAVNFITDFENKAVEFAQKKNCDVAICGHIHQVEIRENYMNSGDWCENCTALVESEEKGWEIYHFHKQV